MGRSPEVAAAVPRQTARLTSLAFAGAAANVAVGLAMRGADNFTAPLRPWLGDVTLIGSARSFLRTFYADLRFFSPPVRAHPPGFLLMLWTMDWLHMRGTGWAAALVVAGGALTVPACVTLAGRRTRATFVAAALVLTALLWPAPEPTGFFLGVTAAGAALVVAPGSNTRRWIAGAIVLAISVTLWYQAIAAVVLVVCERIHKLTQERKR